MSRLMWLSCALLVLLLCAASAADCEGSRVQISAIAGDRTSYDSEFLYEPKTKMITPSYGDTVNVFCSASSATNLKIEMFTDDDRTGWEVQPAVINATTLQLTLEKLDINWYYISCRNVVNECKELLLVRISPFLTVLSPNVRQTRVTRAFNDIDFYFVPVQDGFEMLCTGQRSDSLFIESYAEDTVLQTYVVNDTTIKSDILTKDHFIIYSYECSHETSNESTGISRLVFVYVDYPPAGTNFSCIEYASKVTCKWIHVSYIITDFTLFYVDDRSERILCTVPNHNDNYNYKSCIWDINYSSLFGFRLLLNLQPQFNLVLKACNIFLCANETFHIKSNEILKPFEPAVSLSSISLNNAIVAWDSEKTVSYVEYQFNSELESDLEYKMTYWMQGKGMQPKELDLSTLPGNCTRKNVKCEKELILPCPGTYYEVKVYAKLTTTPANDEYWSNPGSITFQTESQDIDVVDPICTQEEELIVNKQSGAYAVKLLRRDSMDVAKPIFKKINSVKNKLAYYEKAKRGEI